MLHVGSEFSVTVTPTRHAGQRSKADLGGWGQRVEATLYKASSPEVIPTQKPFWTQESKSSEMNL